MDRILSMGLLLALLLHIKTLLLSHLCWWLFGNKQSRYTSSHKWTPPAIISRGQINSFLHCQFDYCQMWVVNSIVEGGASVSERQHSLCLVSALIAQTLGPTSASHLSRVFHEEPFSRRSWSASTCPLAAANMRAVRPDPTSGVLMSAPWFTSIPMKFVLFLVTAIFNAVCPHLLGTSTQDIRWLRTFRRFATGPFSTALYSWSIGITSSVKNCCIIFIIFIFGHILANMANLLWRRRECHSTRFPVDLLLLSVEIRSNFQGLKVPLWLLSGNHWNFIGYVCSCESSTKHKYTREIFIRTWIIYSHF